MNITQRQIAAKLIPLVEKITATKDKAGIKSCVISKDDAPAVKERYPEGYKEYLKLRREFNAVWKQELFFYCDDRETDKVPMEEFLEYLKEQKIEHTIPSGFTGIIGVNTKWYTEDGNLIEGVPSAVMFPTVKMNPNRSEDSPWVFMAVKEDGTGGNYFYTRDFKKASRTKKFEKVGELLHKIDDIRESWMEEILNFEPTNPNSVAAVILELLFQFSARIGSEGNGTKEGVKTYGICTLRKKHCRIVNGNLILSYLGKDGVKTKHVFKPKDENERWIVKIVECLADGKNPKDYLFTYRTGNEKDKPVRPNVVNKLFKELGSDSCTVHKLRTYQATKLALELIDKLKQYRKHFHSQKDAKDALTKIAEEVGKKLNHVRRTKEGTQTITGTTALTNYIDVAAQVEFYKHYDIPFPKNLEKLMQ